MKIGVVGHGTCGKDTVAELLARSGRLVLDKEYCSTSVVILDELLRMGAYPPDWSRNKVYEARRTDRKLWYEIGRGMCVFDPAYLVRQCLLKSDIVVGSRAVEEIAACREGRLLDLVIWVHRPGTPTDPTMKYGPEMADLVINNSGDLLDLERRVESLCGFISWR